MNLDASTTAHIRVNVFLELVNRPFPERFIVAKPMDDWLRAHAEELELFDLMRLALHGHYPSVIKGAQGEIRRRSTALRQKFLPTGG